MVSVSVPGMYGWGNPSFPAARRPWIVSIPQERFRGAFFMAKPRHYALPSSTRTNPPSQCSGPLTKGRAGLAPWAGLGAARL
jgi:hypothetical protein